MCTYPNNSPQAAARIVALAMLADGHLCKSELDALDSVDVHEQLGLSPGELHVIVHGLCEDLLVSSQGAWGAACRIEPDTLASLLAEIDDTALRAKVLQLCLRVFAADEHLADGETVILAAVVAHWGLHRETNPTQRLHPDAVHV
ncbi:MAG: TerB family tellurite resistance protein [Ramlibacter sp.]|nr:TerB family tellurite resistance protein [Ramlibacter sp.]